MKRTDGGPMCSESDDPTQVDGRPWPWWCQRCKVGVPVERDAYAGERCGLCGTYSVVMNPERAQAGDARPVTVDSADELSGGWRQDSLGL